MDALFDEMITRQILVKDKEGKDDYVFSKHLEQMVIDQSGSGAPLPDLIRSLFDLRNIAQNVFIETTGDKHAANNFMTWLNHFVKENIIEFPIKDVKVKTFINQLNNINTEDVQEEWYSAVKDIDIREKISQLLIYYLEEILERKLKGFQLTRDKKGENSDFLLASKKEIGKYIVFEVKYRVVVDDLKSMVLRGIEYMKKLSTEYPESVQYLVLVVFTSQQEHTLNRLNAQFRQILVSLELDLLNRSDFFVYSTFRLNEVEGSVSTMVNSFNDHEVKFDYDDSPSAHQWKLAKRTKKDFYKFIHDSTVKRYFQLKLGKNDNYLRYELPEWVFTHTVELTVHPDDIGAIHLEVEMQNGDEQIFPIVLSESEKVANLVTGNEKRNLDFSFYPTSEWWKILVTIQMLKAGYPAPESIKRLTGIRLAGNLSILSIIFR